MICILKDKEWGAALEKVATGSQLNIQTFIVKSFLLPTGCSLTSNHRFKE